MATKYVVDTHALVWFLEGNPSLSANAKAILESADSELVVPVIVLAEACWIIEHGRTSIPAPADFLSAVDADPRVTVISLDRSVLDKTLPLTVTIRGNCHRGDARPTDRRHSAAVDRQKGYCRCIN